VKWSNSIVFETIKMDNFAFFSEIGLSDINGRKLQTLRLSHCGLF
jgi:hypothetical protein